MSELYIVVLLAAVLLAFGAGRLWQRRQDPLWLEGRLLDQQKALAQRIADLKGGMSADEVAEVARQGKVRADILALDQANQTP